MNSELATQQTNLSIFDSGKFEQMCVVASKLSATSLIPQTLRAEKVNGQWVDFPQEQIAANCFRVVEQAERWGMSPFGVVDCASVVHGKLMWEGKVISSAISSLLGIRLNYEYSGDGQNRKVVVSGQFRGESELRTIEGTVKDWKTDQWKASDFDQRLAYRGARQWARRHAPDVILGVYTPDEFDEPKVRNVTPSIRRETPLTLSGEKEVVAKPVVEESKPTEVTNKEEVTSSEPSKTPAQGRQKKDRHHREADFVDITERSGNGKTWWSVVVNIGQKAVELGTFSESLSSSLRELTKGDRIRITFTAGKAGYALEDYEILNAVEGGIC